MAVEKRNRKVPYLRDVTRAVRGVMAAGATPTRVEIDPDGRLVIIVTDEKQSETPQTPFDAWKNARSA